MESLWLTAVVAEVKAQRSVRLPEEEDFNGKSRVLI